MTELDLLVELHQDSDRQGPGSTKETLRALNSIPIQEGEELKVADIGCGSGAQTLTLAQNLNAHITAIDLFPSFLKKLAERSEQLGLQHRISPTQGSMEDLPFKDEELDIIWSEGAIYIMGFEKGIQYWKKFLKKGGFIAISEISWLTDQRPSELGNYWINTYPEIDTVSNKISQLEKNGYTPLAYFPLPEYCWTDNYYKPLEIKFDAFIEKHKGLKIAEQLIQAELEEIRFYNKYKDYYSYGFYVAQKL